MPRGEAFKFGNGGHFILIECTYRLWEMIDYVQSSFIIMAAILNGSAALQLFPHSCSSQSLVL